MKYKLFIPLASLFFFLTLPATVSASFNIGNVFGKNTVTGGTIQKFSTLSQLFNPLFWNIYILAGIIILFVLLYGGFMYIMGAGQQDAKKISQAHQAITWGLVGLIFIFASFWIIRIIEIMTGMDIIGSGGL